MNLLPLVGFFSQGIAARAEAVANVVVNQSGLDCVQVNNAHGLTSCTIHHYVVDLWVAVNRSKT